MNRDCISAVISPVLTYRGSFQRLVHLAILIMAVLLLSSCKPWNNPYPAEDDGKPILYRSFIERPKHLDPAVSYSADEYAIISQIYEPPLQYHFLKRPYQLIPQTASDIPKVRYLDENEQEVAEDAPIESTAFTEYVVEIKPGIQFQPHPAFVQDGSGDWPYHHLSEDDLDEIEFLRDFVLDSTRELTADDFIYQIKRLVHPKVHSPIAELMKHYIVGLSELGDAAERAYQLQQKLHPEQHFYDIRTMDISGVQRLSRYSYSIRIKGRYPQFRFWLAMPFFAPMAWEADRFYSQPGLIDKNITLDWYPVGTGPYYLAENNPNRRMLLVKNPNYHGENYPTEGAPGDAEIGLLEDAGKPLPQIDRVVYSLEKESIPLWNKFLQGYYDSSGISSDSFDQAIQFDTGDPNLTPQMREKQIKLATAIDTSIYYMGFNMADDVIGGYSDRAKKLRQAISIAVDFDEYISIFANGRGISAQGILPPGIYGYQDGASGINPYVFRWENGKPVRKSIEEAQQLMSEAGYPEGRDNITGQPLVLYYDTMSASGDLPRLNWYRKQFAKLGIQLVIRSTDYNRFRDKVRNGNTQIYSWGWNADYPDPENFFFLLYGPNAKVKSGGENASNYENPEFDRIFEEMRVMDNGPARLSAIQKLQAIIQEDAPWAFGFNPKSFALYHHWFQNLKPNLMANNTLKYQRIDATLREQARSDWNDPKIIPLIVAVAAFVLLLLGAFVLYQIRMRESAR